MKNAVNYLQKSADILKAEGLSAFLRKALKKTANTIFTTNTAIWFQKDLNDDTYPCKADIPIEISFSSQDRIVLWLRNNCDSFPWICCERETEVGQSENHIYPFALYNGKIIGYFKIALRRVYIRDYDMVIQLPEGTAFIYDTFTLPEYRGKKIGHSLLVAITKHLKSRNYRRLWCHIPEWNKASLNLYQKAGFETVSFIRYVRLLNLKLFNRNPEKMMFQESLKYK